MRLLIERTGRLTPTQLFGEDLSVQPQPLGPSPAGTFGGAAGPNTFAPTQAEATAALAQHYGLPTNYIDVSFDPIVAAFLSIVSWGSPDDLVLASHMAISDAYERQENLKAPDQGGCCNESQ